jgi:hypothetical protein
MAVAKKAPVKAVATPTSTPFTQQVISQNSDPNVRLAMLTGAALEGGTYGAGSTIGVGDAGHSYGYFQINLPFHPGMTAASAIDPAKSVAYMKQSYVNAVARVPAALWQSNPEKAAETAAFYAERPAKDYYVARGQAAVDRAYNMAQGALGGSGAPAPAPGPVTGSGGPTPSTGSTPPKGNAPPQVAEGSGVAPQVPKAGRKASDNSLAFSLGQSLGDAVGTTQSAVADVTSVPKAVGKITDTLFNVSFWTRVFFVLVGLGLVFIGTKALLSGAPIPILPPSSPSPKGAAAPAPSPVAPVKAPVAKKSFGKRVAETAETIAIAIPK